MTRPFNSGDLKDMLKKEVPQRELLDKALLLLEEKDVQDQPMWNRLVHIRDMLETILENTEMGSSQEDDDTIQLIIGRIGQYPVGEYEE